MKSFSRLEFISPSLSFAKAKVQIDIMKKNPQIQPKVTWQVNGNLFYSTDCFKCLEDFDYKVARTSIYEKLTEGSSLVSLKLASPEHLAPVFLMWPSRRFTINVIQEEKTNLYEVPMMDGSALSFFNAIRKEVGVPEELVFYDVPLKAEWELKNEHSEKPYGFVRIMPSDTFEVEYILDRTEVSLDFKSAASVSIYSAEDLYSIFESRTFIFENDYSKAIQSGLLQGVNSNCGLLLPNSKSDSNYKKMYRVAEEPARHKILDLLGDLSFALPALPKIRIEILNGGHVSHHQILKKVLPYANFEIFT